MDPKNQDRAHRDPETRFHELLFRQLQERGRDPKPEELGLKAMENSGLHHKMDQWEASYRALCEVQTRLTDAYKELQVAHRK